MLQEIDLALATLDADPGGSQGDQTSSRRRRANAGG